MGSLTAPHCAKSGRITIPGPGPAHRPRSTPDAGARLTAETMSENSTTRTLQSYLPLAAIGGLLVLINRALIGHDPYYAIRSRINLPAAEEFFFSPTGSSPALIFTLSLWFLYSRRHRVLA